MVCIIANKNAGDLYKKTLDIEFVDVVLSVFWLSNQVILIHLNDT